MSNNPSFYRDPVPARNQPAYVAGTVFECSPKQSQQLPSTVPVVLNWNDYKNAGSTASPTTPISINLQGGVQQQQAALDSLRSIKIDNIGCPSTCTVYFPDTGDEVVCPGYSMVRANVETGGFQAVVYMPLDTKNLGKQTTIFFNNFQVDTSLMAELLPTENVNWASGAPFSINFTRAHANGDQWTRRVLDLSLSGAGSQVSIFNGPPNGYNFVVLSEIHFKLLGNYTDSATPLAMNASIVDNVGTTYITWDWYARNDLENYYGDKEIVGVVNQQSIYSSYIAANTFRKFFLQNNVAGIGKAECDLVYTLVNLTNF